MSSSNPLKSLGIAAALTAVAIGAGLAAPLQASAAPLRIYVAGESIERRNCMSEAPFTSTGSLNDPTNNDDAAYGWMIPFAERLKLRHSGLSIEFVGADGWLAGDDYPYDGAGDCRYYPTAGRTSAMSGSDNYAWMDEHGRELTDKQFCYDVAFVSRGGNDTQTDDEDYKRTLTQIIALAVHGSSCNTNPLVYVTGHMPDSGVNATTGDAVFVTRVRAAVDEYQTAHGTAHVRFVDQFTPFKNNTPTTAFPTPNWRSGGGFNMGVIGREGDGLHPKRFASIYAGEVAANAVNLDELTGVMAASSGSSTPTPSPTPTPTPAPVPTPSPVPVPRPVPPSTSGRAHLGIALFATPYPNVTQNKTLAVRVIIKNDGPATAENVIADIPTPVNTAVVSVTRTSQGGCSTNDSSVRCDLNDLRSGGSIVFTVTYRVSVAGQLIVRGTVMSDTSDSNTTNNQNQLRLMVTPARLANLVGRWVSATQTCRLVRGVERCSLRGSFEIRNTGNKMASAQKLKIVLSSNATLEARDVTLKTHSVGSIAVRGTRTVAISVPTLPVVVHPAYFIGLVDSGTTVAESSESDNQATIQVR